MLWILNWLIHISSFWSQINITDSATFKHSSTCVCVCVLKADYMKAAWLNNTFLKMWWRGKHKMPPWNTRSARYFFCSHTSSSKRANFFHQKTQILNMMSLCPNTFLHDMLPRCCKRGISQGGSICMTNDRSPQLSPSCFFIHEGIYGWTHSRFKKCW